MEVNKEELSKLSIADLKATISFMIDAEIAIGEITEQSTDRTKALYVRYKNIQAMCAMEIFARINIVFPNPEP